MTALCAAILGIGLTINGLAMLGLPDSWYSFVPGVAGTGPLNPHFVRDIGAAYFVSGAALTAFAADRRARGAALAGAAFLALHALVHLADAAAGRESLARLLGDLPAVFAPAALALWLAWPRPTLSRTEKPHA